MLCYRELLGLDPNGLSRPLPCYRGQHLTQSCCRPRVDSGFLFVSAWKCTWTGPHLGPILAPGKPFKPGKKAVALPGSGHTSGAMHYVGNCLLLTQLQPWDGAAPLPGSGAIALAGVVEKQSADAPRGLSQL